MYIPVLLVQRMFHCFKASQRLTLVVPAGVLSGDTGQQYDSVVRCGAERGVTVRGLRRLRVVYMQILQNTREAFEREEEEREAARAAAAARLEEERAAEAERAKEAQLVKEAQVSHL